MFERLPKHHWVLLIPDEGLESALGQFLLLLLRLSLGFLPLTLDHLVLTLVVELVDARVGRCGRFLVVGFRGEDRWGVLILDLLFWLPTERSCCLCPRLRSTGLRPLLTIILSPLSGGFNLLCLRRGGYDFLWLSKQGVSPSLRHLSRLCSLGKTLRLFGNLRAKRRLTGE
jgi:hypothetical protein